VRGGVATITVRHIGMIFATGFVGRGMRQICTMLITAGTKIARTARSEGVVIITSNLGDARDARLSEDSWQMKKHQREAVSIARTEPRHIGRV
jgi:hypothetical protein